MYTFRKEPVLHVHDFYVRIVAIAFPQEVSCSLHPDDEHTNHPCIIFLIICFVALTTFCMTFELVLSIIISHNHIDSLYSHWNYMVYNYI